MYHQDVRLRRAVRRRWTFVPNSRHRRSAWQAAIALRAGYIPMKRLDKVITMADAPLIDIVDVTKHFPVASGKIFSRDRGAVKAIDGVSFAISEGEAVGLVGESGCGKTTMARLVLRLEEPTSGEIRFRGKVLTALSKPQIGAYRAAVQAVFQDPQSSLSPRMRIGDIIAEPLVVAGTHTASEIKKRVAEVLEWVELDPESARL